MKKQYYNIEDSKVAYGAKMKVIGVGGGGGNMINHMIREGFDEQIELIVANTDSQALEKSSAMSKITLGNKTRGLGAGMIPEVGREAAEESFEEIKDVLENSDVVFISAGLGGGTGTGAAPIVAKAAKEKKALTIGVVTTPFAFEGKKRMKLALEGIEELKKECDSIIVIPNQKLVGLIDKKVGIKDSFKIVDNILTRAVRGMTSIIIDSGESDINLDFADVKTVMSNRGLAIMGVGVSEGDNSPVEALKDSMQSPLLNDMNINGAMGVLVHFKIHPNCSFFEIDEAMNIIRETVDENADVFFGTTTDESIQNNRVEVTLIATGFEIKQKEKEGTTNLKDCLREHRLNRLKKVSSGDFNSDEIYDELETPSYLRNQMD